MIRNVLHFLLRLTSRARIIYYRSMGANIEGAHVVILPGVSYREGRRYWQARR
jgi:hypothetical protein